MTGVGEMAARSQGVSTVVFHSDCTLEPRGALGPQPPHTEASVPAAQGRLCLLSYQRNRKPA